jgi:MerR family transcriptional regulator/heat shock protein HspR
MNTNHQVADAAHHMRETLYSIGEAADLLGISIPTLRLYEREGLLVPIRKPSRHRLYLRSDLDRVRCIRKIIGIEKVSIAGMKRALATVPCWSIRNCPDETRSACPAFVDRAGPCWIVSQRPEPCRPENCHTCTVYRQTMDCTSLKRTILQFTSTAA